MQEAIDGSKIFDMYDTVEVALSSLDKTDNMQTKYSNSYLNVSKFAF